MFTGHVVLAHSTRRRLVVLQGLVGLLVAATLAAAMSSIDSVATAGASLFCLDLYKPFIKVPNRFTCDSLS